MRKNFRVAECLVDGRIGRYAIFADGTAKVRIDSDENGNEYFQIENPYARVEDDKSLASYKQRHFYNLIKDAIQAIREDYADAIICKDQTVGGFIKVVRFVDEAVGREYRNKTLNGWKNTKFGCALRAGCKNSWSGYSLIGNNGEKLGILSNTIKYRTFANEEDAIGYATELLDIAKKYAEEIVTAENHEDAIGKCFDDVCAEYGKFSIIEDFMCDLVTGNGDSFKNEAHELDEYGYDVVQCVIPEREDVIENEWLAQASCIWPGFKHTYSCYENWETKDIEKLISDTFKDFYENNKDADNLVCKTNQDLTDDMKEKLFQNFLECVRWNKELLYPVA